MELSNLVPKTERTKARRIGRGGKRGKTSGRGTKGQYAHGSHGIRAHIRDIIRKLPKLKGRALHMNKTVYIKPTAINLAQVSKYSVKGDMVDVAFLVAKGLVAKSKARHGVKILAQGELTHSISIQGNITVSKGAMEKITAKGGTITK